MHMYYIFGNHTYAFKYDYLCIPYDIFHFPYFMLITFEIVLMCTYTKTNPHEVFSDSHK